METCASQWEVKACDSSHIQDELLWDGWLFGGQRVFGALIAYKKIAT